MTDKKYALEKAVELTETALTSTSNSGFFIANVDKVEKCLERLYNKLVQLTEKADD